jgi:hypothetical protein
MVKQSESALATEKGRKALIATLIGRVRGDESAEIKQSLARIEKSLEKLTEQVGLLVAEPSPPKASAVASEPFAQSRE